MQFKLNKSRIMLHNFDPVSIIKFHEMKNKHLPCQFARESIINKMIEKKCWFCWKPLKRDAVDLRIK